MLVISRARLRKFWESPGCADSQPPLLAWHDVVAEADWRSWASLKDTYPAASIAGDCVVFNIGGHKYRLITRVRYRTHRVYVLKVMTHREYDLDKWKDECGCYRPPPPRAKRANRKDRKP